MEFDYSMQLMYEPSRYHLQSKPQYIIFPSDRYLSFMDTSRNYLARNTRKPTYEFEWRTPAPIYDPKDKIKYTPDEIEDYV